MIGSPIGGAGIGGVTETGSFANGLAAGVGAATAQGGTVLGSSSTTTGGVGTATAVGMLRPFELRPDGDTATDGWTNQAASATNIYQSIDEVTASDSDFVQSPEVMSPTVSTQADLKVRLYEGAALIVEWTHTDIGATYVDAEQTLTAPQFAAITSFANLFVELDDNLGNVYRFPVGDPAAGAGEPVKIKYRYKKLVGAGAMDAATVAWAAQVVSNGGTVSSGRLTLVNTLIVGLKADGVWTKLDRLWLFAGEDQPSALTDIVATALATATNSPSFTVDRGYTSNGTSSYVDTNFNPATAGGNFTQNSAHASVWDVNSSSSNYNVRLFGQVSGGDTHIYPAFNTNTLYGRINNGSNAGFTVASPRGLSHINRSGSNATETYKNGSSVGTDTPAANAVINTNFSIGFDISTYNTDQFAASSIGGSLSSTDAGNLYSRLRTYMTAVGVP